MCLLLTPTQGISRPSCRPPPRALPTTGCLPEPCLAIIGQSRVMGTSHNELRAILQRHEGTIHRRWLKKTNPYLSPTLLPRVRLKGPSTSRAGSSSTQHTATRPAAGFEPAKTSRARVLSTPTCQRRSSSAMRRLVSIDLRLSLPSDNQDGGRCRRRVEQLGASAGHP